MNASGDQGKARYKEALLADTREELQKVDTKSSILLATVSVIFAALLAGAVSGSWSVTKIAERGSRILIDISLILGVIGLGLLGAAVKPRVHRTNQTREHLYFFGHVESFYPQGWKGRRDKVKCEEGKGQFFEAIDNASASNYDDRLDDQIWHLSHLVYWKYKLVSTAMWLFAVSIVLCAAALIWGRT
jgi:hypothetical protein